MATKISELSKWQTRLNQCLADYNEDDYNMRELIYNGTHEVDSDVNDTKEPEKLANVVVNAVYEFIEGMVDSTIPDVTVTPKNSKTVDSAKVAENMVRNIVDDLPMTRLNDINERTTYIQGISFLVVNVDEHGQISLDDPHPKNVIWPKGETSIQDLDYLFILYSKTKDHIKRRYKVDVENESEEHTRVRSFDVSQEGGPTDERVTLNVCWYKDADGDVCKFAWVNNTVVEDIPKYYHRRISSCTECGQAKDDDVKACTKCGTMTTIIETCATCGQEMFGATCQNCGGTESVAVEPSLCTECGGEDFKTVCPVCGNDRFQKKITDTETLALPVEIPGGTIPAGAVVPYYVPRNYPVVERINVPVNLQLEGQSDIDVVRDLQDALKKVVSTMVEKLIRGGTIITALKDHRFKLTNKLYDIIRGNPQELAALDVKNLSGDIVKDLTVAQFIYKCIQNTIGITDSWLGKEDSSARTGIAKQIQVQQSGGRLNSKYLNKNDAYGRLYRTIFDLMLAFDDNGGEYITASVDGTMNFGEYNRYMFLRPDGRGGWEYDTRFVFRGTPGVEGLPKDKNWLLAKTIEMKQYELIDQEQFWSFMEAINYPMAGKIKEDWQKKMAEQKALAAQQAKEQPANPQSMNQDAILQHLKPEEQALFNSLPKEQQQALLQELAAQPTE